jgi:putative transposase
MILVPSDEDGLRRALAAVHRRYAAHVHARLKQTGHFRQGRFGCVAMDEAHFGAALRYVALNPVQARLTARAIDWRWSSIHALLGREDDGLTDVAPVIERYPDFAGFVAAGEDEELSHRLRKAETIGRPIGDPAFMERLEGLSGRSLKPARRGPKGGKSALSP